MSGILEPYVDIMQNASGLDRDKAIICVYYALATHFIKSFQKFPTLVLYGSAGTGKTSAAEQLYKLCYEPKTISGRTSATVREELTDCSTGFIDEADGVPSLEDMLTRRYSRANAIQTVNQPRDGGYYRVKQNLFGATVICCRHTFKDVAMRSRSIIIQTESKFGKYKINDTCNLQNIVSQISCKPIDTHHRVMDTWAPLLCVAMSLNDNIWVDYATTKIMRETLRLGNAQGVEPSNALSSSLEMLWKEGRDIRLSEVRYTLKAEFDTPLSVAQVLDMCDGLDIPIIKPQGCYKFRLTYEQLQKVVQRTKPPELKL